MKRFVNIINLTFIIMVAPLCVVLGLGYVFRTSLNAPFYYGNGSSKAYYQPTTPQYAKIKKDCYLFASTDITDLSYRNVKFILPESYFVVILSHVSAGIDRVEYDGKVGYVDSNKIKAVDFVPAVPTLEGITFDISSKTGTHIRSAPSDLAEVLDIIPASATNITFVGEIVGDIPVGGSSNIWYLAIYTPSSNTTSVIEGYVYSERVVNLTPIVANSEDIIEPPISENDGKESFAISGAVKATLIVLICVPIVLVFVLLVISNHKNKSGQSAKDIEKQLKNEKEKPSKSRAVRTKIHRIEDLEGQSLHKKEAFLSKPREASTTLRPQFPTYEVIDDDDLL